MTRDSAILDFGSSKITVLTGIRGVNGTMQITGMGECAYAGFSEGKWLRPELLSMGIFHALKAAEECSGVRIRRLYIGVPGEFTVCSVNNAAITLGRRRRISEKDVEILTEQGNIFGAADYTLINAQPIYYNIDNDRFVIAPTGFSSKRLSGCISYIFAENRFIDGINDIMESMQIESVEYVSSILAEALYLLEVQKRDRVCVLADVGYSTSSVAVVRGDGLLSLNSFSVGGGNIARDISQAFGITPSEAEALKRKVMISLRVGADDVYEIKGKELPAGMVNKIILNRLSIIAKAIDTCIKQCPYEIPESTPLYLTGGGICYMRGAKEFVGQLLNKETEITAPSMPQYNKPHLSSSFGLLNMVLAGEDTDTKKGLFGFLFGN